MFRVDLGLIGDSVAVLPALAAKGGWPIRYCGNLSQCVADGVSSVEKIDDFDGPVITAHAAWRHAHSSQWTLTMTQAHYNIIGLPVPSRYPVLPFKRGKFTCEGSFGLIAPFSRTDNGAVKGKIWPDDHWKHVVTWMLEHVDHVFILGSSKIDDPSAFTSAGARFLCDEPLAVVVNALRKAVFFASIDTGIAHIAQLAGIANHVMVYPDTLPKVFAETPWGINLRGRNPVEIKPAAMIEALKKFI